MQVAAMQVLYVAAAIIVVMSTGCDDPTDTAECDNDVAANLRRLMYWGRVAPDHEVPNQGDPSSTILKPLWYAPDRVLVVSQRLNHGTNVRGLFDVALDPTTKTFSDIRALTFPYAIHAFDFDSPTETYLILYTKSSMHTEVIAATEFNGTLSPVSTVVDSTWFPLGARFESSGRSAIVYCLTPPGEPGFYHVSLTGQGDDSLLIADDLTDEAAGFDVGSSQVFYGRTTGRFPYRAELLRCPLNGAQIPTIIASLAGRFVSISVDASETCLLVSRYLEGSSQAEPPGNRIDVVNLSTGEAEHVDVRTHRCNFVIADFATWNPLGAGFAFSAASFSTEGDFFPRELWVCDGLSCR